MVKICSLCGDSGYENLLMTCFKCKSASIHPYCTFPIVFDASFDWVCEDCCPQILDNVETSKKRVKRSSNMDAPPTLPPNDHFQGQKMRKKKQKRVKNPAHQVILHDPEHIKRYEALKGRKIVNTRYLDDSTLDALGIRDDVEWMAKQVGWSRFLTMKEPTYISLTLEFLSSVTVKLPRRGPCHDTLITFRLNNENRELSLEQFNAIFDFRNGGVRVKNPKEVAGYDPKAFWREITDEKDFDPTKSSASQMCNPCFRVMHRLMACTVFARSNKSFVRSEELLHLWAMVHGHNVDSGAFLALQLQTMGRAKTGDVEIGGIVTSIARSLGVLVDMEGLEEAKGKNRIDIGSIRGMIEYDDDGEEGQYKLRFARLDKVWTLPDPTNTTVRVRENWKRTFKGGMEEGGEDLDQSARDGVDLEAIHDILKAQQGEMDEIRNMVSQIMGEKVTK